MKRPIKQNSKTAPAKPAKNNMKKTKPAPKQVGRKESNKKLAQLDLDQFLNSSDEEELKKTNDLNDEFEDDKEANMSDEEDCDDSADEEVAEDSDDEGSDMNGEEDSDLDEEGSGDNEDEDDTKSAAKKHKKTLEKLKNTDPEFYKFLSDNDRALLEFDTSDSEDDERGGKVHKLPKSEDLAVGSDESDEEDAINTKRKANVVTLAMVKKWQTELRQEKCLPVVAEVVSAFRSAVHSVNEEKEGATRFVVQGGAVFNAVVRLCLVEVIPAFRRVLKCEPDEKLNLERRKKWTKLRMHVKSYLADVIRLLGSLTESTLLGALLKHMHQLIPFYAAFIKLARVLCKRLVILWSSGEDTVRVLAFLCLLRLARSLPSQLLEPVIKGMYLSYAKNSKFTSPSTWPLINFMRRSLVELLALHDTVTYKHAFLYIRQLAIHLRNAITLKKKDSISVVYNWQFVHCLHLWSALLGALPESQCLKPLVYPLVQIAMGAINLVPTARYYPLRFHLTSIMNQLSVETGVFIPVLPFLLEVIQNHNFEKKPGKASMKPLDLSCVLRVSQSQLAESGYRDAIIELLYDRMLETLSSQSHSCAFPEVALPVTLNLKQFIKKCPLPNYSKKMKQLADKLRETVQFIEKQRSQVHFELTDAKAVLALENQIKQNGTPLTTYLNSWKKMRDREMAIKIAKKPEVDRDDAIPSIKRPLSNVDLKNDEEFKGLFPSDISDDKDDLITTSKNDKSGKRKLEEDKPKTKEADATMKAPESKKRKTAAEEESDEDDIGDKVVDFNMSDEEHDDESADDEENSHDGESDEDEEGDEEDLDEDSYDTDDEDDANSDEEDDD